MTLWLKSEARGRVPLFLAVDLPEMDPTQFTSKIMRWTDRAWLLDLGVCRRYWRAQAAWRQVPPAELLASMLRRLAGGAAFRAVLADDPWKAVLLLEYMDERSLAGLIDQGEAFGRGLYQQVSWTAWAAAARRYGEHCRLTKAPHFHEAVFRRQLRLLLAAAGRLSLARPGHLAAATVRSVPAIKRRFGAQVARLWEWTFAPDKAQDPRQSALFPEEDEVFAGGFPWTSWSPAVKPRITRSLDYAVWQWDHLEPLLVEDFDRLCQAAGWRDGESVVHVLWALAFDDGSGLAVDIRFRHPHRLHGEVGVHRTAVLQSSYAFHGCFPAGQAADDLGPPRPMIGWTMTVEGRMAAATLQSLFGELDAPASVASESGASHLRLENQLPVPVLRFSLAGDWSPEASFKASDGSDQGAHWRPWLAVAKGRPLYIYKEPRCLDAGEAGRRSYFLERTTAKWWVGTDLHERDYFVLEDHQGKWRWGFQDVDGRWCVHGVFG